MFVKSLTNSSWVYVSSNSTLPYFIGNEFIKWDKVLSDELSTWWFFILEISFSIRINLVSFISKFLNKSHKYPLALSSTYGFDALEYSTIFHSNSIVY